MNTHQNAIEDYASWEADKGRSRQNFYHAKGETSMTFVTCIPEHALESIGYKPGDRAKVEFVLYGDSTDSQGKPVIACVSTVKKLH